MNNDIIIMQCNKFAKKSDTFPPLLDAVNMLDELTLQQLISMYAEGFQLSISQARENIIWLYHNCKMTLWLFGQRENIIGMAVTSLVDNKIIISDVVIKKPFRGMGLGNKLLQQLMCEHQLDDQSKYFMLQVKENNMPALRLYKKLGFCAV